MKIDTHNNYIIQTVSNALDLLEQFQDNTAELGISDLSHRLNMQKNNVFRLVATLNSRHYIEKNDQNGKYRLGAKTRALGHLAIRQTDFLNYARPALLSLKQQCRETCYFTIISDFHTHYLDCVESDQPVRVALWTGSRRPLHCTASGKIQLAFMSPDALNLLLDRLELTGFTPNTITDPDQLRLELKKTAEAGYAIEDQEHDSGVMEIAAPVFDAHDAIIGSLCISGPAMRFTSSRLESELIPLLCREAARMTEQIVL